MSFDLNSYKQSLVTTNPLKSNNPSSIKPIKGRDDALR